MRACVSSIVDCDVCRRERRRRREIERRDRELQEKEELNVELDAMKRDAEQDVEEFSLKCAKLEELCERERTNLRDINERNVVEVQESEKRIQDLRRQFRILEVIAGAFIPEEERERVRLGTLRQ